MKHLAKIQAEFIKSARDIDKEKVHRFLDYLWKAEDDLKKAKSPERRKDAKKRIKLWKKRIDKLKAPKKRLTADQRAIRQEYYELKGNPEKQYTLADDL